MPDTFDGGGGGRGGVIDQPPDAQAPGPWGTPDDTMAYRCPTCNIDWPAIEDPRLIGLPFEHQFTFPDETDIGACPICDTVPHFAWNLNPIGMEEAWSLKNHADFERYYAKTRGEEA